MTGLVEKTDISDKKSELVVTVDPAWLKGRATE